MSTAGMPLIERSTAKGSEGAPVLSQWRVAIDAYRQMVAFLHLTPGGTTFNAADKASMERDLERLAQCVGQMDSGQRGKGVSFDEVPHVMSRLAVACMRLKLSGKLDELEVDGRGPSATIHCDQKDCEHRKDGLCTSVLVEVQSQECMTYAYVGGYGEEEEE